MRKHTASTLKEFLAAIVVAASFGLGGCGSNDTATTETANGVVAPIVAPRSNAKTITTLVFDVPILLGKNIDEVTALLGTPIRDATERQQDARDITQHELYARPNAELQVTYTTSTKAVTSYNVIVLGPQNDRVVSDTSQLLLAGNLRMDDPRYKVEFISAGNPGQYTGAKVTPQRLPSPSPTTAPAFPFPTTNATPKFDRGNLGDMMDKKVIEGMEKGR